jgi:hypothetical protein
MEVFSIGKAPSVPRTYRSRYNVVETKGADTYLLHTELMPRWPDKRFGHEEFMIWLQQRLRSKSWSSTVSVFCAWDGGKLTVLDVRALLAALHPRVKPRFILTDVRRANVDVSLQLVVRSS